MEMLDIANTCLLGNNDFFLDYYILYISVLYLHSLNESINSNK